MGDTFRGLITWPARYLTRHIRVLFLAVIQPRRYYYYYYYYYYYHYYYYYYKRFQCYQEPILLIASYTLLEPGPIHGPEVPGEFFI